MASNLIREHGQVKHDIKAQLTVSASGSAGGEGARTHIQVLANSIVASVLIALHTWFLWEQKRYDSACFGHGGDVGDVLVVGIVA